MISPGLPRRLHRILRAQTVGGHHRPSGIHPGPQHQRGRSVHAAGRHHRAHDGGGVCPVRHQRHRSRPRKVDNERPPAGAGFLGSWRRRSRPMITRFADASIRVKLIFAMALVTALALLVSAGVLGAYEVGTFRRALEQKLTVIADIVGRNCQVALAFGTPKDASELLAALDAEPAVEVAAVYDREGRLFASYHAAQHARLAVPSTPTAAGVRFENGALIVVRPIVLDRDLLGTVYIRSGLDELAARMRLFGLVVLAILTGSGLLGFVVSSRLQRWIAAPILDLAHTARLGSWERK